MIYFNLCYGFIQLLEDKKIITEKYEEKVSALKQLEDTCSKKVGCVMNNSCAYCDSHWLEQCLCLLWLSLTWTMPVLIVTLIDLNNACDYCDSRWLCSLFAVRTRENSRFCQMLLCNWNSNLLKIDSLQKWKSLQVKIKKLRVNMCHLQPIIIIIKGKRFSKGGVRPSFLVLLSNSSAIPP